MKRPVVIISLFFIFLFNNVAKARSFAHSIRLHRSATFAPAGGRGVMIKDNGNESEGSEFTMVIPGIK